VAPRESRPAVRAAGGVVWHIAKGKVEVALVHRPRYDDWSLPKGKLEPGEHELAAAVREVGEELGSRVVVSRRLGRIAYLTTAGRKTVAYWVMRHLDGEFTPGPEVDRVQWVRPRAAGAELTYDVDRQVMSDFAAVPLPDSVIVLVRHARAGKRSEWSGNDLERPLDASGRAQAERLVDLLSMFGPDRIVSAEPVRCVQTMQPLADHLGLTLHIDPVFGDIAYATAPEPAEDALMALAKPGKVTVVCSQGGAIPGLVDRLGRGIRSSDTKKAGVWVLSIVDGTVVSTDYYEDATR
jgi:phosphohistidine phosphatase SixA/8-oxo-dGTP pyrophosphatase MutT (NUDIX family)